VILRDRVLQFVILFAVIFALGSCKTYKQDVLFRYDEDFTRDDVALAVQSAKSNYKVQTDDLLSIDVFTNDGERIVDPNFELSQNTPNQAANNQQDFMYLVQKNGKVKLPLVGLVNLEGLTIQEAEDKLERQYDSHYKGSFVKLAFENKRVVVLGANGGEVIPLTNENMSILEVIALAGGVPENGRAQNIKLLRGVNSTDNQIDVYHVDLSRISTMKTGLLKVQENDIIYIEPRKRPVNQALADAAPILGIISSLVTLVLVIQTL